MSENIKKEILENGICLLSLEKSPVNALSYDLLLSLNNVFKDINNDKNIRVVILKSSLKHFSAGADLKERKIMSKSKSGDALDNFNNCFNTIESISKPTICIINGYCLGGGAEMALSFDFRIGLEDCIIGFPEVGLGIIPGAGGTQRLPKILGISNAKYWIYTAKKFNSTKALEFGFLNFVSNKKSSLNMAISLANEIISNAPIAVSSAKKAINTGYNLDIESGLLEERECYKISLNTKDRDEALDAFINKRKPKWSNE
ncbi:enoyl-CoA hydratase-related protein [Candidatus Marinimicrobia bacterium]|nr:enoyl-CoA hydratase-related protein [Candidatus Neomarinimicrobiota bacterium]